MLNDLRFGLGLARSLLSMVTLDMVTRRVIERVIRGLPQRDITGPDGSLYMRQYLLSNSRRKDSWRLRIHHFVRGDEDRELHNHPWYGLSLILSGGYREEYRAPNEDTLQLDVVRTRDVKPWRFNFITPRTFHRVDLLERDAWTLFLSSPSNETWGFWNRKTGEYEPFEEFFARKGLIDEQFDGAEDV